MSLESMSVEPQCRDSRNVSGDNHGDNQTCSLIARIVEVAESPHSVFCMINPRLRRRNSGVRPSSSIAQNHGEHMLGANKRPRLEWNPRVQGE